MLLWAVAPAPTLARRLVASVKASDIRRGGVVIVLIKLRIDRSTIGLIRSASPPSLHHSVSYARVVGRSPRLLPLTADCRHFSNRRRKSTSEICRRLYSTSLGQTCGAIFHFHVCPTSSYDLSETDV